MARRRKRAHTQPCSLPTGFHVSRSAGLRVSRPACSLLFLPTWLGHPLPRSRGPTPPVTLYPRLHVAMYRCAPKPTHGPAILDPSTCVPVPLLACLHVTQWQESLLCLYFGPLLAHFGFCGACGIAWPGGHSHMFPGCPVYLDPGHNNDNGCQNAHSACAIATDRPGYLVTRFHVHPVTCPQVPMSWPPTANHHAVAATGPSETCLPVHLATCPPVCGYTELARLCSQTTRQHIGAPVFGLPGLRVYMACQGTRWQMQNRETSPPVYRFPCMLAKHRMGRKAAGPIRVFSASDSGAGARAIAPAKIWRVRRSWSATPGTRIPVDVVPRKPANRVTI